MFAEVEGCFGIACRPVLGIQWVVRAVECDGDVGDFFLACMYCRGIAAMASHTLEAILLVIRKFSNLFAVSGIAHLACAVR